MKFEVFAIELSNICNLKCPLCARGKIERANFIKPKDFENIKLNEVDSIKKVQLSGAIGDPITNPYFFDIVDITKKWDKQLLISTNGSFRNENWWYELPKHLPKNHFVRFGIDGTNNEVLNIYRKGANYEKIINNVSAFIKGGGTAIWQMILFKHNEHQVEDVKRKANELGCKYIFVPSNFYNNECEKPIRIDITSDLEYSKIKEEKCRIQLGRIAVSSRGIYLPCCFCYNDDMIYEISNEPIKYIKDYSLPELLEDGYYERILKRVLNTKLNICSNCVTFCGQRSVKI